MKRENRYKEISKIIKLYYEGSDDLDSAHSTKLKFFEWLYNEQDSEIKEEVLKEIWHSEEGEKFQKRRRERAIDSILAQSVGVTDHPQRERKLRERGSLNRALKLVALFIPIAVLLFAAVSIYRAEVSTVAVEWEVPYGKTEKHILKDESEVMINSGSTLSISQDRKSRVAELSGESYFRVAKDKKRPFIVKTEQLRVLVTGTEFNVEAYDDVEMSIVTLIEGSLEVENGDNKWNLKAGEQLSYNNKTKEGVLTKISSNEVAIGWTEEIVVCDLLTIEQILRTVERRYDLQVSVANEVELPNIKYTIKFDLNDSPQSVMEALKIVTSNQFEYKIDGNKVLIYNP